MPIPPDKVLGWLHKGGYPLEYETARHFRMAGFRVEQGRRYDDVLHSVNREVDVLATPVLTNDVAELRLVIECKAHNKGYPWVVLTAPGTPEEWSPLGTSALLEFIAQRMALSLRGLLPIDRPPGFGVVETMRNKDDDRDRAYDTLQQVMSAVVGARKSQRGHVLLWPVVVTESELFRLEVDDAGAEALHPVTRARLVWQHSQAHPQPTALDIVTRDEVGQYAKDMRYTAGEIVDEMLREGLSKAT